MARASGNILTERELERFEIAKKHFDKSPCLSNEDKTSIIANISKRDADFRRRCLIAFNFCPFTGPLPDNNVTPTETEAPTSFLKRSKEYTEFVDLVSRKGWIEKGKLPRKGNDTDLDQFMEKYQFKRRQVQPKFKDLMKMRSNFNERTKENDNGGDAQSINSGVSNSSLYESFVERKPNIQRIVDDIKQMPLFLAITRQQRFQRSISKEWLDSILEISIWDDFANKIIDAFAKALDNKVRWSQRRNRSNRFHWKQMELQQMLIDIHANNQQQRDIVFLLSSDFLKKFKPCFYHGMRDMHTIINTELQRPTSEVINFELVVAQRVYYVAGWMLNAAIKSKDNDISCNGMNLSFKGANMDTSEALPTGIIDEMQVYGTMRYPRSSFYHLVCYLEWIFVKISTPQNQVLWGNTIIQDLFQALLESTSLRQKFNEANIVYESVKRYMDNIGATLTKGIRPTLAVLSDARNRAKKDSQNTDDYDGDEFNVNQTVCLHLYHASHDFISDNANISTEESLLNCDSSVNESIESDESDNSSLDSL